MQARTLWMLLLSSLLALVMGAQIAQAQSPPPLAPPGPPAVLDLQPGDKAKDSPDGREVENTGANGVIKVHHNGTVTRTGVEPGPYVYTITGGSISRVEQPASGGSRGVKVNTNNKETTIDLKKHGSQSEPCTADITGGKATVNVQGSHCTYSVGGTENTVTVSNAAGSTARNNTGTGPPNSGGTYTNNTPPSQNNVFSTQSSSWTISP